MNALTAEIMGAPLQVKRTDAHRLSLRGVDSRRLFQHQQDEYTQPLYELEIAYAIMRGEEEFPNDNWARLQRQRVEDAFTIEWAQQQPEETVRDILSTDNPQRTLVELKKTLTPHPELDLLLLVLLQHEAEIKDIQSSRNTRVQHHSNTTRASLHEYLTTAAEFMSNSRQMSQHPILWHSLELACKIATQQISRTIELDSGMLFNLVKRELREDTQLVKLRMYWDTYYSLDIDTIDGLRQAVIDTIASEETHPQQIVTVKRPDTFEEIIAGEPNLFIPIERKIKAATQATRDMFRSVKGKFTRSDNQNDTDDAQPTDEVSAIIHAIEPQVHTGMRRSYGARFKPSTTSERDSVMNTPA